MPINIRRIINCPICQTQFTISLAGFSGQIQITCSRCDCTIINWIDDELTSTQKNKKFRKTTSNAKIKRQQTAKRIPVQSKVTPTTMEKNKFTAQENNFVVQENNFAVQENNFAVQENNFAVQENNFIVQENNFTVQENNFTVQENDPSNSNNSKSQTKKFATQENDLSNNSESQTKKFSKKEISPKINNKKKFTLEQNKLERIGDYLIIRCINSGSMGEIYLAQHIGIKNYAAIKLLNSKLEKDIQATERFKQEARVHSRLEHQNIVSIYDVDTYNEKLYIVMEYIEGESLEKVLSSRINLNPKHTLKIAIAVAKALEHALKQKIIHRDLKPANIMIDRRNRKVKLADFGLGKILEEDGATLTGQMMGTAYYMAPEQVYSAKEVDHRADIYALGATMYHMLTGRPPYSEITGAINILKAKVNQNPEPMQNLPKEIIKIVERAMHLNINKRFQNPAKMKKAMEHALDNL